jgi:hypothetical protein
MTEPQVVAVYLVGVRVVTAEFRSKDDADKALNLNGITMNGHKLEVFESFRLSFEFFDFFCCFRVDRRLFLVLYSTQICSK